MFNLLAWLKVRNHQLLLAILAFAALLIFFRLDRADMQTDGALYSTRALGYFDFLDTSVQSTPVQWFETIPWWSRLSFHDAPPLAFGVQHLFFRLLGASTWVARLPGALAGLTSVFLIYLIGSRLWGVVAGRWAALFLASSTLFTWAAREPYLESQEIAWILLATYAFLRALKSPRWWYLWGAALGAALLTKYTAVFLLPAFGLYLLLYHRPALRIRQFWLGAGICALLLSPVAVYNLKLYQTRGHLDLQLSRLVPSTWPAAKVDWPKLYETAGARVDVVGYAVSLVRYLADLTSRGYYLMVLAGVGWLAWRALRRRLTATREAHLLWLALGLAAATLVFTGPAPRLLPLLAPWLALAAGGMAAAASTSADRIVRAGAVVTLAAVLAAEVAYNLNTNQRLQPSGAPGGFSVTLRLGNDGYQQLAAFLEPQLAAARPDRPGWRWIRGRADFTRSIDDVGGTDVFIYQANQRWFSAIWYFQRHAFYRGVIVISDLALGRIAAADGEENRQWIRFFKDRGVRRLFYVAGANPTVFEPNVRDQPLTLEAQTENAFRNNLDRGAPGTMTEIKNPTGQVAFRVYEVVLNR